MSEVALQRLPLASILSVMIEGLPEGWEISHVDIVQGRYVRLTARTPSEALPSMLYITPEFVAPEMKKDEAGLVETEPRSARGDEALAVAGWHAHVRAATLSAAILARPT